MKQIAIIAILLTLAVPAAAHHTDATRPVIAKTSASQRALAQLIADRIQSALDAEPFAAKNCKDTGCTASAH